MGSKSTGISGLNVDDSYYATAKYLSQLLLVITWKTEHAPVEPTAREEMARKSKNVGIC